MNDESKPLNTDLLRRVMMGGFSSVGAKDHSFKENRKSSSPKRRIELDLHFDKLYPHKGKLSSSEKLALQLQELRDFLTNARKDNIRSAYIIVGKGEGILRKKVRQELSMQNISSSEILDPPYFGNALKIML